MSSLSVPRLPVLGWRTFAGRPYGSVPSLGDNQNILYTTSGRAAIELGLKYLKIGPGDRVLVPTYHCPTMIAPIVALGAEPVFFPITSGGLPDLKYLGAHGASGSRAMIAVHYFGFPRPMAAVRKFCDSARVSLIEDCAHAFFGLNDGIPIGRVGDLAIGSLTKFFPVSEGGCLIGRDSDIGRISLQSRNLVTQIKALLDVVELGIRYRRLPGLRSAFSIWLILKSLVRRSESKLRTPKAKKHEGPQTLLQQVSDSTVYANISAVNLWLAKNAFSDRIILNRRRNFRLFTEALTGVDGVEVVEKVLPESAVPYVFPILIENTEPVYRHLRGAGVPVSRWDVQWPGTPRLPGDSGDTWAKRILQVACHQDMSIRDVASVAAAIRQFSEGAGELTCPA